MEFKIYFGEYKRYLKSVKIILELLLIKLTIFVCVWYILFARKRVRSQIVQLFVDIYVSTCILGAGNEFHIRLT